jgi:hypothetical protein
MPELIVDPVPSAGDLRRSLSPGEADEYGSVDGTTLVVDDAATAETLVETYPNVRWVDSTTNVETYPDETMGRAELDNDGVSYPDEASETDTSETEASAWTEADWLDADYQARADSVRAGDVDAHLDDIEACETSKTVIDAVENRRDDVEG